MRVVLVLLVAWLPSLALGQALPARPVSGPPALDGAAGMRPVGPSGGTSVPSNADLKALPVPAIPSGPVHRAGFASAGDGGAADYRHDPAPCRLNDGAGDDGSQVPAASGGCWIASLPSPAGLRIWGADPTGTADSAARINAAIAAAGSSVPLLVDGRYRVDSSLTATGSPTLIGIGGKLSQYATSCPAGISAFVTDRDIDLLKLTGPGGSVQEVCFQMGTAAGQRTAGAAIMVGGAASGGSHTVARNTIIYPHDGIDVGGPGLGGTTMDMVADNQIIEPSHDGAVIGRLGGGGYVNDLRYKDNSVVCQQQPPASFKASIRGTALTVEAGAGVYIGTLVPGMVLLDNTGALAPGTTIVSGSGLAWTVSVPQSVPLETMAGSQASAVGATALHVHDAGLVLSTDNEAYGCNRGTAITPGARQFVLFWGRGILGDSSLTNGFYVAPTHPGASVLKLQLDGWWVGSAVSTDQPVRIANPAGARIDTILIGPGLVHGTWRQTTPLIWLSDTLNHVAISGVSLAADNGGLENTGILDQSVGCTTVSGVTTTNAPPSRLATAIRLSGTHGCKTVVGNDLSGGAAALAWDTIPTAPLDDVIANNGGLDGTVGPTLASAATVAAPFHPVFYVSGTAPVSQMTGFWTNRVLTVIPTGAFPIVGAAGGPGAFCNGTTATPLVPITARYLAPFGCWRVDP